jgi:hypothetical protein
MSFQFNLEKIKMRIISTIIMATSLSVWTLSAQAILTEYFGEDLTPGGTVPAGGNAITARNNFLSSLSGVGNEDFESLTLGSFAPFNLSFPGSTGSITATLTNGGPAEIRNGGAGRFATSGTQYLETDGGASFNVALSDPISAFGFYGTDIGDFGGQITLAATNGTTTNLTVPNTINAPDGSLLFYGFIDTTNTYKNILFGNTSGSDFFGFDDMVIGDPGQIRPPVPEPVTLLLMGMGLAGLGFARKRKSV